MTTLGNTLGNGVLWIAHNLGRLGVHVRWGIWKFVHGQLKTSTLIALIVGLLYLNGYIF